MYEPSRTPPIRLGFTLHIFPPRLCADIHQLSIQPLSDCYGKAEEKNEEQKDEKKEEILGEMRKLFFERYFSFPFPDWVQIFGNFVICCL